MNFNKVEVNFMETHMVTYFIRPNFCYYLSKNTNFDFKKHVSRQNTTEKLSEFIKNTDYFIFEMFYHMYVVKQSQEGYNLKFHYLKIFNFGFIFSEQIILIFLEDMDPNKITLFLFSFLHLFYVLYITYHWLIK